MIIEQLGNISQYLQRLCEYQEDYENENQQRNPPPPPSDTSRPGTPSFRRPPASPLSSPHPSLLIHRQEISDVVMAPPPSETGKPPHVNLIQPTPDNSQRLSNQVTQLLPTPIRLGDISTSSPAAFSIADVPPTNPLHILDRPGIVDSVMDGSAIDTQDEVAEIVEKEVEGESVQDTVDVVAVEDVPAPVSPVGGEMSATANVENAASPPNVAVPNTTAVPDTAAVPEDSAVHDDSAVDNLSIRDTVEQQPVEPLLPPSSHLGPATRTRSRSRTPNPEGAATLDIPASQPVRYRSRTPSGSLSPHPNLGEKRKAEGNVDDGIHPKKRKT